MPRKVFVAGEILTAADVNANLMDQVVQVFDDSAARTTALPSPTEGMVTYLKSSNSIDKYSGTAWLPASNGFTASETITATNASWPVPTLGSPIVKVIAVGGGGSNNGQSTGGDGGTTTFNAGGAGTVTALGGRGSVAAGATVVQPNPVRLGLVSANGSNMTGYSNAAAGASGCGGGEIRVSYLDLTGISTVNVTIGAAGSGAEPGGRGEVIVEYVAG